MIYIDLKANRGCPWEYIYRITTETADIFDMMSDLRDVVVQLVSGLVDIPYNYADATIGDSKATIYELPTVVIEKRGKRNEIAVRFATPADDHSVCYRLIMGTDRPAVVDEDFLLRSLETAAVEVAIHACLHITGRVLLPDPVPADA